MQWKKIYDTLIKINRLNDEGFFKTPWIDVEIGLPYL